MAHLKGEQVFKGLPEKELAETITPARGRLEHWMDQIVAEAQKRGDFDDLPGKGKPLDLGDRDPFGGIEAELYGHLKKAGFTPEWVELRQKIAAEISQIRTLPRDDAARLSRITEVNSMIARHNRQIPNPSLTFPKVPRDFGLK